MPSLPSGFLEDHARLTRRYFLRASAVGLGIAASATLKAAEPVREPRLEEAIRGLESWLTPPEKFRDVSRGDPLPHTLPDDRKGAVGLTRESWKLEVVSDPEHPAKIRRSLSAKEGTALDFAGLMKLAERHAVRFPKVMTCLNIGCPLGMGIWEGVPLRDVLWMVEPRENLRRVFYHGYHNEDPRQMFRSSLPVGRVLEDAHGMPPVILCYKLNGQWLSAERGGPVRVVVPEAYGFKSIKWLTTVVLSNLGHANDTYLDGNNDVDSPLKTFAATLNAPTLAKPQTPLAVTGYAQVGVAGLSKVQVWLQNDRDEWPAGDRYYTKAPWIDAEILPPPDAWEGGLPEGRMPPDTLGFDAAGRPTSWPLPLSKIHWARLLPGLPEGDYTLRCRTVDARGQAQPMPRPFQKSGHAAIEQIAVRVRA
jgi:DMSO/TMAO reductase YedYZ molybdopterin-dependent catalytic subunit